MKHSLRTGFCFGLTSGIITTVGLMVGLYSSTNSKMVVIGGIFTIAVADAFSDALGIHIAEESKHNGAKEVWESTIVTFFTKFFIALAFIIPVIYLDLAIAIVVSAVCGMLALCLLSFLIARSKKEKPVLIILEHLFIACVVIVATYYLGSWISGRFM